MLDPQAGLLNTFIKPCKNCCLNPLSLFLSMHRKRDTDKNIFKKYISTLMFIAMLSIMGNMVIVLILNDKEIVKHTK